jgi:hypothetical protein
MDVLSVEKIQIRLVVCFLQQSFLAVWCTTTNLHLPTVLLCLHSPPNPTAERYLVPGIRVLNPFTAAQSILSSVSRSYNLNVILLIKIYRSLQFNVMKIFLPSNFSFVSLLSSDKPSILLVVSTCQHLLLKLNLSYLKILLLNLPSMCSRESELYLYFFQFSICSL